MSPKSDTDARSRPSAPPEPISPRQGFGHRLRAARLALGYTQEQMAYALGIRPARYSKYEIGRSEAPFDVLIRIAQLAKVDLDYLIVGRSGRHAELAFEQVDEMVQILPTPAVVFDKNGRLLSYNALYRERFFATQPRLLKRGTPHEVLARSWAYDQGLSEVEVEAFIRGRFTPQPNNPSTIDLRVGRRRLRIAESVDGARRVVLLIDLSEGGVSETG